MKKIALALPLAALAMASTAWADHHSAESGPRVVAVEARLLYEESGKTSFNLAGNDYFIAFNTPIGEGSAEENATDMMIVAVIEADEQTYTETPLVISVYDSDGEVLQRRTIDGLLLETTTHRSMMFEDGTCAGEITVEAKLGNSVKRSTINMLCGE